MIEDNIANLYLTHSAFPSPEPRTTRTFPKHTTGRNQAQIDACLQQSIFAISSRPHPPKLYAGEPLLLPLVKDEARKQGKEHARVNFALFFDHLERNYGRLL